MGLCIFCHAVLAAGPGLLLGLEPLGCRCCGGHNDLMGDVASMKPNDVLNSPLYLTLRLLEEGCRLGEPLKTTRDTDGEREASLDPLSISAEAELHLRGLLLLMRLTEHARVRVSYDILWNYYYLLV